MATPLKQIGEHWMTRSFGAGVVSTVVDVGVLFAFVHGLGWKVVPSSMLGVIVGSLVSFALNKYFAFRDGGSPILPQLGKYAATLAIAMMVHASLMGLMVDHLHAPLLAAKLLADVLVFTCGSLWVMRFVVFRVGSAARPEGPG